MSNERGAWLGILERVERVSGGGSSPEVLSSGWG